MIHVICDEISYANSPLMLCLSLSIMVSLFQIIGFMVMSIISSAWAITVTVYVVVEATDDAFNPAINRDARI